MFYLSLHQQIRNNAAWCNGNTLVFGTKVKGSNPLAATNAPLVQGIVQGPSKPLMIVRIFQGAQVFCFFVDVFCLLIDTYLVSPY